MKQGATLQRRAPMNRGTGFKPAAPKPVAGPRPKRCKHCRCNCLPDAKRPWKNWCSDECALQLALDGLAKKKAKDQRQERAADKVKREQMKRRPELLADAQAAFNAYIRLRDADKPCICCGRTKTNVSGLHSHGWDAGHYRSVGSAPHMRFEEDNVHKQLVYCNRNKDGNAVEYRRGLIARIGLERVEALECDQRSRDWSHDDLREIKAHYQRRVRELKKEMTACVTHS